MLKAEIEQVERIAREIAKEETSEVRAELAKVRAELSALKKAPARVPEIKEVARKT